MSTFNILSTSLKLTKQLIMKLKDSKGVFLILITNGSDDYPPHLSKSFSTRRRGASPAMFHHLHSTHIFYSILPLNEKTTPNFA